MTTGRRIVGRSAVVGSILAAGMIAGSALADVRVSRAVDGTLVLTAVQPRDLDHGLIIEPSGNGGDARVRQIALGDPRIFEQDDPFCGGNPVVNDVTCNDPVDGFNVTLAEGDDELRFALGDAQPDNCRIAPRVVRADVEMGGGNDRLDVSVAANPGCPAAAPFAIFDGVVSFVPRFDRAFGGGGRDDLRGGPFDDGFVGGSGGDSLFGRGGSDVLEGQDGDDTLDGAADDDTLNGGTGDDILNGRAGRDSLVGGDGTDRLLGGGGNDTLNARDGIAETVDCGTGGDVLERDSATVDLRDNVIGCELAVRFAADDAPPGRPAAAIVTLSTTGVSLGFSCLRGSLPRCSGTLTLRDPGGRTLGTTDYSLGRDVRRTLHVAVSANRRGALRQLQTAVVETVEAGLSDVGPRGVRWVVAVRGR